MPPEKLYQLSLVICISVSYPSPLRNSSLGLVEFIMLLLQVISIGMFKSGVFKLTSHLGFLFL